MDTHDDGNVEQTRIIAKAIARQMIEVYGDPAKAENIPAPLKWGAAIFGVFITVGSTGLLWWMVSSISSTLLTVNTIATRQEMTAAQWENKFEGLEQRMDRLEQQQRVRGPLTTNVIR